MKSMKFRVHLPYECLFDLKWGFIRKYSGLTDLELFPRFNSFCSRVSNDLTPFVPTLTKKFVINSDVVKLAPKTAILTLITNCYRQYAADFPDRSVTLHITVDYHNVQFIPVEVRKQISAYMSESMSGNGWKVHSTYISDGYSGLTLKNLRKNFNAVVVEDINAFIQHYNADGPSAYAGIGILTRPLFINGARPEDFTELINSHDKRNPLSGEKLETGDHYDIVSDVMSHLGPIYIHRPEYFSAILPK